MSDLHPEVPTSTPTSTETAPPVNERSAQLKAAGILVAVLVALGALLGLVWQVWSPPGPAGAILPAGIQPDETEEWVAGDARFALMAIVVGALAGVLAWYLPALKRVRGPYVAAGLGVGGIAGSLVTVLVGWAVRGDGNKYPCGVGTCVDHLPLSVHMHGLWFVEAFLAVLVYGMFVAFAVEDDLGRPDPGRKENRTPPATTAPPPEPPELVHPEHGPQYGG